MFDRVRVTSDDHPSDTSAVRSHGLLVTPAGRYRGRHRYRRPGAVAVGGRPAHGRRSTEMVTGGAGTERAAAS